ncbi:MAG: ABC transporter ATP-binding protein [Spirochaetales bacterium]|nr:ABC transporter ATP-binding protein [Spirochaetales bacterium]
MSEATSGEAIFRVSNLSKDFPVQKSLLDQLLAGGRRSFVHAVDDISFDIQRGEVLGLAGESGSGKSTTGRLLLRLIEPTSGRIEYHGRDLTTIPAREMEGLRAKLQIVFQDPNSSLSPRMTLGQAIGHPLKIHGMGNAEERKARVLELMEKIGLTPAGFLYRKYPHQISGGQAQRVVLGRALVTNPEFIVADEPIAMADVSVRALILELMKALKDEFQLTYLFITHDLATAKYLCDRIAIMYLGRIVEMGSRDELFGRPHHPYTKALLEAVPVPDPNARRTQEVVRGEIPSAINPPSGCHFHPRCPYAMPACREGRPPLKDVAPGHLSACLLD